MTALFALLAPALLFAGCGSNDYKIIATVSVTPEAEPGLQGIDVEIGVGDIRLKSGPLQITADLLCRSDLVNAVSKEQRIEDHLRIETVDGQLRIRSTRDEDDDSWRFDLTLQIPDALGLHLKSGVGDVSGQLGSLTTLELRSGVGDVRVDAGSITGDLRASSGVGDLRLTIREKVPATMTTSSGVGDTRITLPADAAVAVDATTGLGTVSVDRPKPPEGQATSRLKATGGTGDVRVR